MALKVIKPGMDTSQVVARIENDRQAIALMEHPNIARVLDVGEQPSSAVRASKRDHPSRLEAKQCPSLAVGWSTGSESHRLRSGQSDQCSPAGRFVGNLL